MYNYQDQKPKILTDQGQQDFLKVRDKAFELLRVAGAFEMFKAASAVTGDTWYMMALVDRMVELGEIIEITSGVRGQDRVFVKKS